MKYNEDFIRDKIAENLSILPENLELIGKEYFLKANGTTKSFIDILAKDANNNYVIIEIKRSNQSSRQAIHELYKYVEALKINLQINNGEVRCIVISTAWEELYVPFSNFVNETKYSVKGYLLLLDKDNLPKEVQYIEPYKTSNGRIFSPEQKCCFYHSYESLQKGIASHHEVFATKSIKNYVLIVFKQKEINHEKFRQRHTEIVNSIIGEFASESSYDLSKLFQPEYLLYSAFQRLTVEDYKQILSVNKKALKNASELLEGIEDEEEIFHILEGSILDLKPYVFADDKEIGYPGKFASILNNKDWEQIELTRSGDLAKNILLDDKTLLSEIKGSQGTTGITFRDNFSTSHRGKYEDVKERVAICLKDNPIWHYHTKAILEYYSNKKNYDCNILIFNPQNILFTIHKMTTEENYMEWTPHFVIEYKNDTEVKVYLGVFHWDDNNNVSVKEIIDEYFEGDDFNLLVPLSWGGQYIEEDGNIMQKLGLTYETYLFVDNHSDRKIFHYKNYRFNLLNIQNIENGLFLFLEKNKTFVYQLNDIFSKYFRDFTS